MSRIDLQVGSGRHATAIGEVVGETPSSNPALYTEPPILSCPALYCTVVPGRAKRCTLVPDRRHFAERPPIQLGREILLLQAAAACGAACAARGHRQCVTRAGQWSRQPAWPQVQPGCPVVMVRAACALSCIGRLCGHGCASVPLERSSYHACIRNQYTCAAMRCAAHVFLGGGGRWEAAAAGGLLAFKLGLGKFKGMGGVMMLSNSLRLMSENLVRPAPGQPGGTAPLLSLPLTDTRETQYPYLQQNPRNVPQQLRPHPG